MNYNTLRSYDPRSVLPKADKAAPVLEVFELLTSYNRFLFLPEVKSQRATSLERFLNNVLLWNSVSGCGNPGTSSKSSRPRLGLNVLFWDLPAKFCHELSQVWLNKSFDNVVRCCFLPCFWKFCHNWKSCKFFITSCWVATTLAFIWKKDILLLQQSSGYGLAYWYFDTSVHQICQWDNPACRSQSLFNRLFT